MRYRLGMPLLILLGAMVVLVALLFWRITTQSGYRVKNRDMKKLQYRAPSRMENAPNLSDMLD